ncbi:hypothetical protein RJ640_012120 [Escallonia rubra]|uniref:Trichome birefringence-like N-terminal domain-containing protein n=1 Tax=Escallonia rubra TaxID=112253 RepID=A0AA88RX41_9ASTE|nr:hypothetical protein RJ640_012120 [Escallonia rubra]
MKYQAVDQLSFWKNQTPLQRTPRIVLLVVLTLVLLIFIPLYYPFLSYTSLRKTKSPVKSFHSESNHNCDIFSGEWIPNPEAPYYTNKTCWAIHEHQNCMKYGRPDSEFTKWKWKPEGCELPVFDPYQFFEIVRGKSLAFVGDSVGRNQMQSLICLLSRVEYPIDASYTTDEHFKRWKYSTYNFTLATFWTPFLVKFKEEDADGPNHNGLFNIYLDEFDEKWTTQINEFDYIILSTGHWFYRPTMYYENRRLVGCHFCQQDEIKNLSIAYGYRRAFRTAFRAINSLKNFKGTTFLRTFSPNHFENGGWNNGGDCVRRRPFRSSETVLEGDNLELYLTQVEEFRVAEREGMKKELKFRLLDTTQAMLMRPDGHPSKYGHWRTEVVQMPNDCVHWCLPGPIDTWADFLLQMLKTEGVLTLLLLTVIPLFYPVLRYPSLIKADSSESTSSPSSPSHPHDEDFIKVAENNYKCDIFSGEWVPNPEAPYYTNTTCWAIHEHQNCMKYGRPDSEFMKWKWKPDGCELPVFNPYQFLEIVRGKSLAFVGDSVGRNQMQSLICLLSRVEYPIDASYTSDENFKRWRYTSYNFTLATFWTPFLVKAREEDPNGPTHTGLFNLYLDEFDEKWTTQVEEFDYIILSGGHWFYRPAMYYENHRLVGCRFCQVKNITDLPMAYGYRKAFRTAFRAISSLKNFKGITFLRTFTPMHFENGEWNNGGNCVRRKPFKSSETALEGDNLELYMTQVEEFRAAEREGRKKGLRFRLLDTTQAMLMRPDGHPSRYGHWPNEKVTLYNDCVHWCLPGPIDTWGDFLLQMLKTEGNVKITNPGKRCNIFRGKWIPHPKGPYYTNATCNLIFDQQNCMKFGRPDTEFLKWRWRPDQCELPLFNGARFLRLVRGKSMAFVGDSVGRNHVQSLLCLIASSVTYPMDVSYTNNTRFRRWFYEDYKFTVASYWSPHLVNEANTYPTGPLYDRLVNLYLDEANDAWAKEIEGFDYVIVSAGQWFFGPQIYYENNQVVGCYRCHMNNVKKLSMFYGYRKAFRTAFRTLQSLPNFKGVTFLRTFSPAHFENGQWNTGGTCARTRLVTNGEMKLEGDFLEFYLTQMEELRRAEKEGRKRGLKFRALDTTEAMVVRPDGHPNHFSHWPNENVTMADCVHWCLPGPVDTWNEFLLQMLQMESMQSSELETENKSLNVPSGILLKMKAITIELPIAGNTPLNSSKKFIIPILILVLLATILRNNSLSPLHALEVSANGTIPVHQESISTPPLQSPGIATNDSRNESSEHQCNVFRGNWVPYNEGPYYTNETKCEIDDRQNCMKFGRPDTEFMKWRWKPDECELPLFDAVQFLEIVRGKTLAFVGDSVGRNQMQSLVCLLASAANPVDVSDVPDNKFRRWHYTAHNFTIVALWSPLLVKARDANPGGFSSNSLMNLYLDEADDAWAAHVENVDIVILSAGQWFFRPFMYYENGKLVGCNGCSKKNVTNLTHYYGYRMAFRTAFRTILSLKNFKGLTFLRTFSPAHFENGDWNKGGNCVRTRPYNKQEATLDLYNLKFYLTQMEESTAAEREGNKRGLKFRLLDTTEAMMLRPDGHPSHYGHWPHENKTMADCVHWCLPGPIDTWNEFLLQMLKMEREKSTEKASEIA